MNPTLNTIYTQTEHKIKKIANILNLVFVKMLPACTILTVAIACFVAYFTTDAGSDAFELPFTTMW